MKISQCLPYCNLGQLLLSAAGVLEGYVLPSIGKKMLVEYFYPFVFVKVIITR